MRDANNPARLALWGPGLRTISGELHSPLRQNPAVHKSILGPKWVLKVTPTEKTPKNHKCTPGLITYILVTTTIITVFAFGLTVYFTKTYEEDVHHTTEIPQYISIIPVKTFLDEMETIQVPQPSICSSCEVCLQNPGEVTPRCVAPKDTTDPTGCGGLCQLNTHYCRLLDPENNIRACLPVKPQFLLCPAGQFTCKVTHMCVPLHRRCDGVINCYDMSDERDCDCDLQQNFRCGNDLSCVPINQRCDGSVDCWDASDELDCAKDCSLTEYSCHNGVCLPQELLCDGKFDCEDHSDEPKGCYISENSTETTVKEINDELLGKKLNIL